jgi:uncharacterized protein (TIGR03084 family)
MMQQAVDFLEESEALHELVRTIRPDQYHQKTQFKGWTVNDVITHLHVWNRAADLSLGNEAEFRALLTNYENVRARIGLRAFESEWIQALEGKALLQEWRDFYLGMSDRFRTADPKRRVAWVGPDMSVLSSITARLMETWAHGQEIYDLLGVVRKDGDRIRNIVILGVNTFGWTFVNRGLRAPSTIPYVKLTAPSGDIWEFNQPSGSDAIEGDATEFCQVVTQVRNVKDTALKVTGDIANEWMALAQCFAGPPEDPPAPGTRFMIGGHAAETVDRREGTEFKR